MRDVIILRPSWGRGGKIYLKRF